MYAGKGKKTVAKMAVNTPIETTKSKKIFGTVPVTAFSGLAELCEVKLKKGSLIGVEGHVKQSRFTDRDGNEVHQIEVIADKINFMEMDYTEELADYVEASQGSVQ
jgi:single-strand DNA-binding protein